MEEREKNPSEQMQRMKRHHRELGILSLQRRRTILLCVFPLTLVALIAVGGYSLYRYFWR